MATISPSPVIYTQIETAIVARLCEGLGKMVRACDSYGGELDDELATVVNLLPAVWVTFGGVTDTKPSSTSRHKYLTTGTYVVMVGEKTNVRGNQAGRQGGALVAEVGSYPILYAVRRLLSGQDLALPIDHLHPGKVRALFNSRVGHTSMTAFAAEFRTRWIEAALENGAWPAPEGPGDVDAVFSRHQGRTDAPAPAVSAIVPEPIIAGTP